MPEEPFPPPGPGDQEPQGPGPLPAGGNGPQDHSPADASGTGSGGPASPPPDGPDDGWDEPPPDEQEGPQQGLSVCLPAENMELARFGGDGQSPPMAPGPLLAMVAAAVAGGDGAGLAQVPEDMLFAMISGGRRMSSWATWLEFSAMRELALRHPPVPRRPRTPRPAAPGASQAPAAPAGRGEVKPENDADRGVPYLQARVSAQQEYRRAEQHRNRQCHCQPITSFPFPGDLCPWTRLLLVLEGPPRLAARPARP